MSTEGTRPGTPTTVRPLHRPRPRRQPLELRHLHRRRELTRTPIPSTVNLNVQPISGERHARVARPGRRCATATVRPARPEVTDGTVLVKVKAAGLNAIDNALAAGMMAGMFTHEYPLTLGRDAAGIVAAVGVGRRPRLRRRRGVRPRPAPVA